MTYSSTATIPEIAARITAARRVLVTTHAKPDGDALGSALAIARALTTSERSIDIALMGPLEQGLRMLVGETPIMMVEQTPPGDDYDLVVIVDTGAWSQLEPLEAWLRARPERIVGIDHHPSGDDVAPTRFVDPTASACTILILDLIEAIGADVGSGEGSAAEALFLGLATDTGWFRYASVGPRAYEVAARLLHAGIDKGRIYRLVEESATPAKLALVSRALSTIEYVRDGRVSLMSLGPADFAETGAVSSDLTGLVNEPMAVRTVLVSVLLTQLTGGETKLSFRSKPPLPDETAADLTNVSELAGRFGGGGHVNAAGARMRCDIHAARRRLLDELAPAAT